MAVSVAAPKTPLAIWSLRLSLFSICLIVTALLLHRFAGFPTALLLNTLKVGFVLTAAAVVLAVTAIVIIWRTGVAGTPRAIAGLLLSVLVFAGPAAVIPMALRLPMIDDITTDPANPPQFRRAADIRATGANSTRYPGTDAAKAQNEAYPYIKPIIVDRSIQEAYELARSVAKRLGWKIVASEPPSGPNAHSARIEASDKTLILGFVDDAVIRITGNARAALIDLRSASRYGRHDFGRNAARIEEFTRMFKTRLQETVSIADERAAARAGKKKHRRTSKAKRRRASRRRRRRRRK